MNACLRTMLACCTMILATASSHAAGLYVKRDGEWKFLALQMTGRPKQE